MAIKMSVNLRNARVDAITAFVGNAGLLRIYDGTQPATGGTATTLLAELTLGSPMAGAGASAVLTWNSITQDSAANAGGTATWFRVVKSDGTTHCFDGTVTATGGGGDLQLVTTTVTAGQPVQVSSATFTEANA